MKFIPTIYDLSTRSVATAIGASLLAAGAAWGVSGTALVLSVVVIAMAIGWPVLLGLPARVGSALVIALAGLGALAVVFAAPREPWIRSVPLVLAFAVVLAFINELTRPDDRSRLTQSLLGTVAGAVLVAGAAGWLAADRTVVGHKVITLGAIALAVAAVIAALPMYGWASFTTSSLAAVVGAVVVAQSIIPMRMLTAIAVGVLSGLAVAMSHMLFVRIPALRSARAAWAAIAAPIVAAGPFLYAIARLTLVV
ncbi:hypothetical protein [Rarobacter incanus]|uniref:Uncharacterized protein n=1 Tax=Rarobacter incanus TaxID=153494 RepID=A0A542SP84_9MICO|nr:hypothetical protein [Rarobacter incanus]TQK76431.1 hypothetical protein FB389_1102 [Rarobacter incanus]